MKIKISDKKSDHSLKLNYLLNLYSLLSIALIIMQNKLEVKNIPSIAHLVMGAAIGLCLYYISEGRFSKTHCFTLFLNSYLGPDVGWVIGIGRYSHSLLFWPIFAFFLAYVYHYFTRFTIKIDGIRNIELIDLERYKLQYFNTFLLVLAAGIMHIYLDGVVNKGGKFSVIPEIIPVYEGLVWTYEDFFLFGVEGVFPLYTLVSMFIGVSLIFGFIFLFVWFLKNNSKKTALIVFIYIVVFIIFFYLVGSIATMFHLDGGALIFVGIFWVIPLMLCTMSVKDFKFMRNDTKTFVRTNRPQTKLLLVIIWLLVMGLISLIFSILGLINNETIVSSIYSRNEEQISEYFSYNDLFIMILAIEIVVLVISILNFMCVTGLLLKNKKVWKFTVYYHLIFSWTIIGLIIACVLSETPIKEMFEY